MKTAISTILCAATILNAGIARAAPPTVPPGCQASFLTQRAYQSGVSQGLALVERAWAAVNDCAQQDLFNGIVVADLEAHSVSAANLYSICRHTGLMDAAYAALDLTWSLCPLRDCGAEGRVAGKLGGETYCLLSILQNGLIAPANLRRPPVWTCGIAFEPSCDEAYIEAMYNLPECLPFVEEPFVQVSENDMLIQCKYTPASDAQGE
jgi:hypothetical protein